MQIHIFQTRKVGYVSENFHFVCCDLLRKRASFYRKELNAVPSEVLNGSLIIYKHFSVYFCSFLPFEIKINSQNVPFLGAFAKLRKATISFIMSVRLSVRMEQLGSQWTDLD